MPGLDVRQENEFFPVRRISRTFSTGFRIDVVLDYIEPHIQVRLPYGDGLITDLGPSKRNSEGEGFLPVSTLRHEQHEDGMWC